MLPLVSKVFSQQFFKFTAMINKYSILQVEDDRNDVFFLQHAFAAAGITQPVHVARDGQIAIEYLSGMGDFADRARHPFPCLVLLDLKLPRKDGFEVLEWIRGQPNLRQLTVLVLTSSGRELDIDRSYCLGANSFVVKPSELQERIELAKLIKAYWLRFHQMPSVCSERIRHELALQPRG